MKRTKQNTFLVSGYEFEAEQDAREAEREQQNIEMLKTKVDFSDAETMRKLYDRLTEKQVFHTVIGLQFLTEFREYLVGEAGYSPEEITSVKVEHKKGMTRVQKEQLEYLQNDNQKLSGQRRYYVITIVVLAGLILAMLVIAALNPNVGYINTENKILNKYAAWEERLTEREKQLNQREDELNQREAELMQNSEGGE